MVHNFTKTPIKDLYEIRNDSFLDARGLFLNAFRIQEPEFKKIWKDRSIKQINLSTTYQKGVVRGLHFQKEPFSEAKIVRCIKGLVWDVAVDLRKDSKSYLKWYSLKLEVNHNAFFIPEGFAHGFQTLQDNSQLLYIHSEIWDPISEMGVRFDDPSINVKWPLEIKALSERDKSFPMIKKK